MSIVCSQECQPLYRLFLLSWPPQKALVMKRLGRDGAAKSPCALMRLQANRGLLLKANIGSDSIGAAVAIKSWCVSCACVADGVLHHITPFSAFQGCGCHNSRLLSCGNICHRAHPSWTAAASATWVYGSSSPRLGLTFGVENHGNIRCAC